MGPAARGRRRDPLLRTRRGTCRSLGRRDLLAAGHLPGAGRHPRRLRHVLPDPVRSVRASRRHRGAGSALAGRRGDAGAVPGHPVVGHRCRRAAHRARVGQRLPESRRCSEWRRWDRDLARLPGEGEVVSRGGRPRCRRRGPGSRRLASRRRRPRTGAEHGVHVRDPWPRRGGQPQRLERTPDHRDASARSDDALRQHARPPVAPLDGTRNPRQLGRLGRGHRRGSVVVGPSTLPATARSG